MNGEHGEPNYTDSVSDLMIYVHNALKQMMEIGESRRREKRETERERQKEREEGEKERERR